MPLSRQNSSHESAERLITSHPTDETPSSQHRSYGAVDGHTTNSSAESQPEPTSEADDSEPPIDPKLRRRAMYVMPALAIGLFLASADQTIVISSYGKIGDEMKALNQASWIATIYLIGQTSFQPLYGKLSDIFGRKPMLLFAFAVFGVGTLFCGLCRTMNELLAARAVAGIGGGGLTTLVAILLSDFIPLEDRGTWQGYANIVYAVGTGVGAPLGGFFADHAGWRWSFIAQVPLTFAGFLLVYYLLKMPATKHSDVLQRLRKVDFGGAFTLILAISTLLIGLHEGSNIAWHSPVALGCLCASGPCFALFIFIEFKIASAPIAPKHVLTNRTLVACALCNFFALATWFGLIYYLPLYWQAVERLDSTQSAVRLLPGIFANVAGALFAGVLIKRTGKYYWLTFLCYTTFTLGVIPIILCTGFVSRSLWGTLAGTTISGFSNGIGNTSSLIALIAAAGRQDQAVAIATLYLFRSLGSVIGISLTAAVIQQALRDQIQDAFHDTGNADTIVRHIKESLTYIDTLKPEIQTVVRSCYDHATRLGFVVDIILVVGAVGASFFIRERSLVK